MPRPPGEIGNQRIEARLAVRRRVPVLGAALDEGHRHAQPVHFPAERIAPEQHFLRHVLVAVEHRLDLGSALRKPQVRLASRLADGVVKMRLRPRGKREHSKQE